MLIESNSLIVSICSQGVEPNQIEYFQIFVDAINQWAPTVSLFSINHIFESTNLVAILDIVRFLNYDLFIASYRNLNGFRFVFVDHSQSNVLLAVDGF